ncbi:hypothetical protein, partial [Streptomyces erythrochromogenes]|uniref:hypothetical protein n=1 Tax=Streptomyces erythrochromogenes TaxID=285574 RepID=UPI003675B814
GINAPKGIAFRQFPQGIPRWGIRGGVDQPPSGVLLGGFALPFGNSWLVGFESLSGFFRFPSCGN